MKNRSFFYLVIHLLCIEISFSLHEEDEKKDGKDFDIFKNLSDKMSVLYSLMEEIIIILSTASPFDNEESEDSDDPDHDEEEEPELKNGNQNRASN